MIVFFASTFCEAMVLKDPVASSARAATTTAPRGAWSPSSWRTKPSVQIPEYPDKDELKKAEEELSKVAPLVFAGEVRTLQEDLALASEGEKFVLFGGDCAESFKEFSTDHIRDTFRVLLHHGLRRPVRQNQR